MHAVKRLHTRKVVSTVSSLLKKQIAEELRFGVARGQGSFRKT